MNALQDAGNHEAKWEAAVRREACHAVGLFFGFIHCKSDPWREPSPRSLFSLRVFDRRRE